LLALNLMGVHRQPLGGVTLHWLRTSQPTARERTRLHRFDGAQLIVRVRAERIFPNRPRYIRRQHGDEPSADVPRLGHVPSKAKWKRFDAFRGVLASRRSGRWQARLKLPNSDARSSKDRNVRLRLLTPSLRSPSPSLLQKWLSALFWAHRA